MVEIVEERIVRWNHDGLKIELRIMDERIVLESDDGQRFDAPRIVWDTLLQALQPSSSKSARNRPKSSKSEDTVGNQGQPWTTQMDEELRRMWAHGETTVQTLSHHFGRTSGAIAARLVKLDIASSRDEANSRGRVENG